MPEPMQGGPAYCEHSFELFAGNNGTAYDSISNATAQQGAKSGIVVYTSAQFVSPTVYFETVTNMSSSSYNGTVELYDLTNSAAVTGSSLAMNSTTITRLRSNAITLTTGHNYCYYYNTNSTSGTLYLRAARIIIVDTTSAGWIVSEEQVEIGDAESSNATSAANLTYQPMYLYTSGSWNPSPTVYFEASLKSNNTNATAYAVLFNVTANATVSNSTVSVIGTTLTRARTNAITLTTGDLYCVQIYSSSGSYLASVMNAKLIFDQTAPSYNFITAIELRKSCGATTHGNSTTYATTGNLILLTPGNLPGALTYYLCATLKENSSSYESEAELFDVTGNATVSNSTISYAGTAWTNENSSAISPTSGDNITAYFASNSTSGTANIAAAWLLINAAYTSVAVNGTVGLSSSAGTPSPTSLAVVNASGACGIQCSASGVISNYQTPTLVQGNGSTNGHATATLQSGTFTVSVTNAPTQGNVLILTFMGDANSGFPTVSSIGGQAGVTWTKAVAVTTSAYLDCEIWYGIVGSGAGTTATITLGGSPSGGVYIEIADMCEWSGINTSNPVDQTQTNNGGSGTALSTGTTSQTTQNEELCVGCCGGVALSVSSLTLGTPTNSYTLLDGASVVTSTSGDYGSAGYLYLVQSSEAQQSSGCTASQTAYWSGCIATFNAAVGHPVSASGEISLAMEGSVVVNSLSSVAALGEMGLQCIASPTSTGLSVVSAAGTIYLQYSGSCVPTSLTSQSANGTIGLYYAGSCVVMSAVSATGEISLQCTGATIVNSLGAITASGEIGTQCTATPISTSLSVVSASGTIQMQLSGSGSSSSLTSASVSGVINLAVEGATVTNSLSSVSASGEIGIQCSGVTTTYSLTTVSVNGAVSLATAAVSTPTNLTLVNSPGSIGLQFVGTANVISGGIQASGNIGLQSAGTAYSSNLTLVSAAGAIHLALAEVTATYSLTLVTSNGYIALSTQGSGVQNSLGTVNASGAIGLATMGTTATYSLSMYTVYGSIGLQSLSSPSIQSLTLVNALGSAGLQYSGSVLVINIQVFANGEISLASAGSTTTYNLSVMSSSGSIGLSVASTVVTNTLTLVSASGELSTQLLGSPLSQNLGSISASGEVTLTVYGASSVLNLTSVQSFGAIGLQALASVQSINLISVSANGTIGVYVPGIGVSSHFVFAFFFTISLVTPLISGLISIPKLGFKLSYYPSISSSMIYPKILILISHPTITGVFSEQ